MRSRWMRSNARSKHLRNEIDAIASNSSPTRLTTKATCAG
jgi:hypothetical protein